MRIGGIPSRGMKARFTTGIWTEQDENTPDVETGRLRPETYTDRLMESPWVPCCYNASSESFIQCIMVHRWKYGLLV
jgi:hypothetical protein